MAWYSVKANDADVVFSSRIRLARNLSGYAFGKHLASEKAKEIIERVGGALGEEYVRTDMEALSPIKAGILISSKP